MAGLFSRVLSALFPKQMTKEEFLAKAKDVHGNKYDYSKVRYKDEDTRVTIICPIHGKFLATPKAHIEGEGCPKCANGLSEEPQAENTTDVDAYLAFLDSQKENSEDSGLFNDEMLNDIFGVNNEENGDAKDQEPLPIIALEDNEKLRGKITIKNHSVFVYDCNGNLSYQMDLPHNWASPIKAQWENGRVQIYLNEKEYERGDKKWPFIHPWSIIGHESIPGGYHEIMGEDCGGFYK